MSCTSSVLCVAIDSAGDAMTYKRSSWSAPDRIAPHAHLLGVACPSLLFCVAVGTHGSVVTVLRGGRIARRRGDLQQTQLVEAEGNRYARRSLGRFVRICDVLHGVCRRGAGRAGRNLQRAVLVAADDHRHEYRTWSLVVCIDFVLRGRGRARERRHLQRIQLVSAGTDRSWTEPSVELAGIAINGLSCPSPTFCMAVDLAGRALTLSRP